MEHNPYEQPRFRTGTTLAQEDDDDDDDDDDEDDEDDDDDDVDDDVDAGEGCGTHRFAARPLTNRLFVGHGLNPLPAEAEEALRTALAALLPAPSPASSAAPAEPAEPAAAAAEPTEAGAPVVLLETAHKGYAFATLPLPCEAQRCTGCEARLLQVLEALDGRLHLCGGAPLNVCPATDPTCKHFAQAGRCRLGDACRFRHPAR
jgi:hypothetical protein